MDKKKEKKVIPSMSRNFFIITIPKKLTWQLLEVLDNLEFSLKGLKLEHKKDFKAPIIKPRELPFKGKKFRNKFLVLRKHLNLNNYLRWQ